MGKSNYIEQYKLLYANESSYGGASIEFINEISIFIDYLQPKTVLDFGCGTGELLNELVMKFPNINFIGYDPAIPGKDELPAGKFDLVINTDVLEHVPEYEIPALLEKISKLSSNVYFNLHHALAKTILPNGENAHCTVKPPEWYHALMSNYFEHITPLKGRRKKISVVVTFRIPEVVTNEYMSVLDIHSRNPFWRRLLRKLSLQK